MNLRAAASLAVAVAMAGCHGCHDGHPYVPYAIESAAPPARAPEAGSPVASAAPDAGHTPAFSGEPATLAPPGAVRWSIDGVALEAPEGHVIVSAVARDFDDDGAKDAFAIVRANDGNGPGELAYYHALAHADALQPQATFPPPALPGDPGCTPVDRLVAIGPRSVLVELGMAQCPPHAPSAPDRWVAVVRGGAPANVRLAVALTDPPGAGALSVDAETADRDADALEDVALRISLEGGAPQVERGPRVGVVFAWLDRPAGLSRDLAATESSFASLAATATARALRRKEAPEVPAYAAQVRALWRAVCAESGSPRVIGANAVVCGAARSLESLGLAEARAYATMGDPLRAALAIDRVERPSPVHTGSRLAEAQKWMAQVAPPASALSLRAVAAVPAVEGGREPAWGSLAFEPGGKLLVRTRAGVVRVDPDAGDEAAADGVAEWKSAVTSPDGVMRWMETYDPCDGLALRAAFATASNDDPHDVALPVAPPLGDRCVGSRGPHPRTLPVAWGSAGIEAIVEGEPVLIAPDFTHATIHASFADQPFAPGAPRSPDGTLVVIPTVAGVLVRSVTRARLLRAPELDGTYADQHDCAVSNGGTHVACVRAGRAWVGAWDGL